MIDNRDMIDARWNPKDEFYTQIVDIEKEMTHYKEHFEGKVVFCNCDDPHESHFYKYFKMNFKHLKLKKVITTHYDHKKPTYKIELTARSEKKTDLKQNGDFRSPECLALLKKSDIVVTNPPFSLFRYYVATLMEHGKSFIIMGNVNAISTKDIFPLIQEKKMWLGPSIRSGDREFRVPDDYPLETAGARVDDDGNKYIRVKGVRWYTNLDHEKLHQKMTLYETYDKDRNPKYDNYDAIDVGKTSEIPKDYDGHMGVPITFMDKYSPDQFDIIGIDREVTQDRQRAGLNGRELYPRIIIKRKAA